MRRVLGGGGERMFGGVLNWPSRTNHSCQAPEMRAADSEWEWTTRGSGVKMGREK